jgi:murein DD-endopeptidase MepM/ murein hydrolase activator NlpD
MPVLMLAALLSALPSLAAETPTYTVHRGDSLSLIAKKTGVTLSHLRRSNDIKGDLIHQGQVLLVPDALKSFKPSDVKWGRPVKKIGKVLRRFGNNQQGKLVLPSTGVDVACPVGTEVLAPATGIIRHAGAMDGVGTVLIVEHGGTWTSVLAPVDPITLTVRLGEVVLKGDILARTAQPAAGGEAPHLHVELRQNDKAVSPDRMLK